GEGEPSSEDTPGAILEEILGGANFGKEAQPAIIGALSNEKISQVLSYQVWNLDQLKAAFNKWLELPSNYQGVKQDISHRKLFVIHAVDECISQGLLNVMDISYRWVEEPLITTGRYIKGDYWIIIVDLFSK
ncbi:hypothetical protein FQN52_007428, partial [Onygenales sp. PD_12]